MLSRLNIYHAIPLTLFIALSLSSFGWPVKEGKVTSSFGESRGNHFHDGVDMTSPDKHVYPVKKGDLVFFWDKSVFPLENYPGPGNFKILDHGGNIYSLYMHLEDGGTLKKSYGPDESMGIYGNTGHSYGTHIHFSIIDPVKRISYNPFKFFGKVADEKQPEVLAMLMRIGDKYVQIRDKSKIRLTKHYPLLLEITDSMSGAERLGIYKLTVFLNNRKVFDRTYKQLYHAAPGLMLAGKTFGELFDEKGYYRVSDIKYISGENRLKVVAADFSDNVTEKEFTFDVTLDMPSTEQ